MFSFLLEGEPTGGGWEMLIIIAVMFVALYFLMIRPQKKREQETNNMRNNLEVGDEITTIGGIIGEIVSIKENTITIETSKAGTKIRLLKSAVATVDLSAAENSADGSNHNCSTAGCNFCKFSKFGNMNGAAFNGHADVFGNLHQTLVGDTGQD